MKDNTVDKSWKNGQSKKGGKTIHKKVTNLVCYNFKKTVMSFIA